MTPNKEQRFSKALRKWARRPPVTPPAQGAARVAADLEKKDHRALWRAPALRWAAAALTCLALATWWALPTTSLRPNHPSRNLAVSEEPSPIATELEEPSLDDNVAVFWLDAETSLYLTLSPPKLKTQQENRS